MKAKISVCLIVRNEPLLEKSLLSIKNYVDEIVVVDTGSSDNTSEIAKKYADKFAIYTDCNNPETGLIENFSQARQFSFNLASNNWVMWMDADDILDGAENLFKIIEECESLPNKDGACILFPYEYSYDEFGVSTCTHYRERLVYNHKNFKWVNPVHEVLIPISNNCFQIMKDDIVYKHQRQYSNKTSYEAGRNLRILKKYVESHGKDDARQLYYLGLEYHNNGMLNEAIEALSEYVSVSGWEDEKCLACLKIYEIYHQQKDWKNALKWAYLASEVKENWGECFFAIAKCYYHMAEDGGPYTRRYWEKCVHYGRYGLSLPVTKTLLFVNKLDRNYIIYLYLNTALNNIGDVNGALEAAENGLKTRPNDSILLYNKKLYKSHLLKIDTIESLTKLKDHGDITDSQLELMVKILNKEVNIVTEDKSKSYTPIERYKDPSKLDIIFYAGDGVEIWTPETVKKTGIGGSELMLLEQAKRLSSLGHRVTVYNSCGNLEGLYDNVEYLRSEKFNNLTCDVLIVSRRADALDDGLNVKAKLKLLWVHDIFALNGKNEYLLKADRILALTQWHKDFICKYHNVHPDHVIVTRNGIDLERFNKKLNRNKYKVVNSSSPDRSWPILLTCWSEIKKQVPKAELHLYYGFKNWEFSARQQNNEKHLALISSLKDQIERLKPHGVVYHDRVNQEELAEEFLSSGVWAYPTWFTETSCITAMEAQAAGLRIVTSSIAALNETVSNRGILIDGDWTSESYRKQFVKNVVDALNKNDGSDRVDLQKFAKSHFGLNELAENWNEMFYLLLNELEFNPIVPYQTTPHYSS